MDSSSPPQTPLPLPLSDELIAEIKRLHFQTRRLVSQTLSGDYRSAFRGRGMEFEEVREYAPGDEIRTIDWKVTARRDAPYIKSFREERELTVLLVIDVTGSTFTGTREKLRAEVISQLGAVLSLIALQNNDKVGLLVYGSSGTDYFPPRKGRGPLWRVIREIVTVRDQQARSRRRANSDETLGSALRFLRQVLKRQSVIFVISDFREENLESPLRALSQKHDVTGVLVSDPADFILPRSGLIRFSDPETGRELIFDTSHEKSRALYEDRAQTRLAYVRNLFRTSAAHLLELNTATPFIHELRRYFGQKASHFVR